MPTLRRPLHALLSCLAGAVCLSAASGCADPAIVTVYTFGDGPLALEPPRVLPDGDTVVVGTRLSGLDPVGGLIGRVGADDQVSWRALEGEMWSAVEYRFAVAPDGRVAFALQHGMNLGASTVLGLLDGEGEVVWSQELEGVTPTVLDVDAAGNIVLGAHFSGSLTVDGEELAPEKSSEAIALRVTAGGDRHLLHRTRDKELDVTLVRLHTDGSGFLATGHRSGNTTSQGALVAFDAAGGMRWNRILDANVVGMAPTPRGGVALVIGWTWTQSVLELDENAGAVRAFAVQELRYRGEGTMGMYPRLDLAPDGQALVSGGTEYTPDRDGYLTQIGATGEPCCSWLVQGAADQTLTATWGAPGTAMVVVRVDSPAEDTTSINGTSIAHRGYRDDVLVKVDLPTE